MRNDLKLLLFLLQNNSSTCPPQYLLERVSDKFFELASSNKVVFALEHLITCPHCHSQLRVKLIKKLNQQQYLSITTSLMYEREKRQLIRFLKQHQIPGVFFKDATKKTNRVLFSSADIDLLTSVQGAKKLDAQYVKERYKKTHFPPKEISYSKKGRLDIDVHTLIAHPHYGSLTEMEEVIVRDFSAYLIKNIKRQRSNASLLLSLCLRFFLNDLATGLGNLYEMLQMAKKFQSQTQWERLLKLADQYNFRNQVQLCLMLASRYFQQPLSDFAFQGMAGRIRLLARLLPLNWITDFPNLAQWHLKQYFLESQKRQERLNILKFILNKNSSFFRLLRPRIILFFINAGLSSFPHYFPIKNFKKIILT